MKYIVTVEKTAVLSSGYLDGGILHILSGHSNMSDYTLVNSAKLILSNGTSTISRIYLDNGSEMKLMNHVMNSSGNVYIGELLQVDSYIVPEKTMQSVVELDDSSRWLLNSTSVLSNVHINARFEVTGSVDVYGDTHLHIKQVNILHSIKLNKNSV